MCDRGSGAYGPKWVCTPVGAIVHDVAITIVCKNVPVVTLARTSPFDRYASWMLQAALDTCLRADMLYVYTSDMHIEKACTKLGLRRENYSVVRLYDFPSIKAVGHGGRRACLLACVCTLSIRYPHRLKQFWASLDSYGMRKNYTDVDSLLCLLQVCAIGDEPDESSDDVSPPGN